jgi:hypothetical protein
LDAIVLSQFLVKVFHFLILSLNPLNILAHSQSADTADADANEDMAVVLESFCFLCYPTIVDEQCKVKMIVKVMISQKMRSCVSYMGLTQSILTNAQMAFINL